MPTRTCGVYRSGLYLVERCALTSEWYADGPGVDAVFDTKADAQAACCEANERVTLYPIDGRRR
jgi:hypothetical protein